MNRYPTDEELNRLIENLEQQELYAPSYLKDEIMRQAFPKQTVQVLPKSKSSFRAPVSREQVVSLFSYRLKIVVGMAAAITMLAIIPIQGGNRQAGDSEAQRITDLQNEQEIPAETKETIDVKNVLNERTRKMNQTMSLWTENISNQLKMNFGGNEDEN